MPESHHYIWFGPETVQALKVQLEAAGPDAILLVRGQGEHMTLEVVASDVMVGEQAGAGALNEAHPCPPFCR